MQQLWNHNLSFIVNSVAISDDAAIVAAGTYYYPYPETTQPTTDGKFGTYCFNADGSERFRDEYDGNEGIYTVALSGDAKVVASGGLLSGGLRASNPNVPTKGLVRAFTSAGAPLVNFSGLRSRVNSVSLSHDGSVLAGVTLGGDLFVFLRGAAGFPSTPLFPVPPGSRLDMVCVHPSGKWLIASGAGGAVHLVTLNGQAIGQKVTWTSTVPGIELLACALARQGDSFVAGGKNKVYLFTMASMTASGGPHPVDQFDTPSGGTTDDVRWLAMSGDGSLVTVVQNLGHDLAGLLLTLSTNGGHLKTVRPPQHLNYNPNSTSIDDSGQFITAADGHPFNAPGTYYLYRAADGQQLAAVTTPQMNWPMVISANGLAACAGSDNGSVHYFVT